MKNTAVSILNFAVLLLFCLSVLHISAKPAIALNAKENDPGYERLSGLCTPKPETISSIRHPLSNLKGARAETSNYDGKTYNHASEFDGLTIYNGIDVSYHQGNIDFNKVKEDGIEFVILRLGYRGYSNGSLVTDSKFKTYLTDATAAGLPVGVYFWTEAITVEEAVEEANYVLTVLADYKQNITMPVALDWELNSKSRHSGLSKELNTSICEAFCDTIAAGGYIPMIYANISDLNNSFDGYVLSAKYPIWVARYNNIVNNDANHFYGTYCMWQYSSSGSVDGISGKVDMDFWYSATSPQNPSFTYTMPSSAPAVTQTPEPDPYANDIDELNDIADLTSSSAGKSISLSWKQVKNADGYQIYRKDYYDDKFQLIHTIEDGEETSWKNINLEKKHEYYYKIRAYHKNYEETIYSEYCKLTAATKGSSQVGIAKKSIPLYKKPAENAKLLMTIKAGTPLEHVGITWLSNGDTYHHFRYYTAQKTYDAYREEKNKMTYYTMGLTTAKLNLRHAAGTSGKLLAGIPKHTAIPLMGTKHINGAKWYKTCYAIKKKKFVIGYVAGNYVRTS